MLALQPTVTGYGYVLFEGAARPVAWHVRYVHKGHRERNAISVVEIENLLDKYHPDGIALEDWVGKNVRRSQRIRRLKRAIAHAAQARGIGVYRFTKDDIRTIFASVGAATRYEVAQAITRQFPALAHRLPRRRKAWESESPSMGVFAAAALGVTFYAATGQGDQEPILSPYYRPGRGMQ